MNIKNWYESKTIIFNVATTLLGIVTLLGQNPYIQQNATLNGFVVAAVGVIGIILRFVTTGSVSLSKVSQ